MSRRFRRPELAQIAEECSQTERRAAEAERELVEWKKVRFMQDRVGEEFAALVLNPTKYGMFVELTDLFVEGLVPIDTLRDDRYTWRENTHEIVGERWGRRFRAGDRVQVILDRILAQERRLQFSIVEEGIPLTGRRPGPGPAKAKKGNAKTGNPGTEGKSVLGGKARGGNFYSQSLKAGTKYLVETDHWAKTFPGADIVVSDISDSRIDWPCVHFFRGKGPEEIDRRTGGIAGLHPTRIVAGSRITGIRL